MFSRFFLYYFVTALIICSVKPVAAESALRPWAENPLVLESPGQACVAIGGQR